MPEKETYTPVLLSRARGMNGTGEDPDGIGYIWILCGLFTMFCIEQKHLAFHIDKLRSKS